MSYNILPKNNNDIIIEPCVTSSRCTIFKSSSFLNLYLTKQAELERIINMIGLEQANKVVNTINIPDYICNNLNQSIVNTKSHIFFDLIEISTNLNLIDLIKNSDNCLHVSNNCSETIKFVNYCDKENIHNNECTNFDYLDTLSNVKFEFCFIEITSDNVENPQNYLIQIVKSLFLIINCLKKGSLLILKIDYLFYKPVIDLLYILSCIFEKTYITKPSTSNILSFEKYVVCKNLISTDLKTSFYDTNFMQKLNDPISHLISLINEPVPCYFINKITEIDVMLGQIVLESMHDFVNIIHNNKNDKIETVKKNNVQKANVWCNKYKPQGLPLNDRKNIFLNT